MADHTHLLLGAHLLNPTAQPGRRSADRQRGHADRAQPPADVLGYGLHPAGYPWTLTVCRDCFPPHQADHFEAAYDSDAYGEIRPWTVDDQEPVHCDVCHALIHPGHEPHTSTEESG